MRRTINEEKIKIFESELYKEEKCKATVRKYVRDLYKFVEYLAEREISKEELVNYKEILKKSGQYKISSINSFLAAVNHFCEVMGWQDIRVKMIKMQREAFCIEKKHLTQNEYKRLIETAEKTGKERIALIIQTIGSTGIRISELQYITVESLKLGMTDIYNKGKMRRILLPKSLIKVLKIYVNKNAIQKGAVFQTSSGKAIDRSNVWREMRKLCKAANVEESKVFPHNFRHLFARSFYELKKDIAKLADVLGHSNIETTRIYIKSTSEEHLRQLNSMKMVITT